jgi:FkbM family methyltransferase
MDDNFIFYDENNKVIDIKYFEYPEQYIAEQIINENCVVLELGARYGTVSCRINRKLGNSNKQVSVEPDSSVWDALEKNRTRHCCNFYILKGAVSRKPLVVVDDGDSYGRYTKESTDDLVNRITLEELETVCNLKFNTLIADCEGFLEQFFEENPRMYEQLELVFFEKDFPERCNYEKIKQKLKEHGFNQILDGFHEVWKK